MNKYIPLSVPSLQGNEWQYVKECLDTEWVSTSGKYVDLFEEEIAFEVFNAGGEINNFTKKGIVDAIIKQLPNSNVIYKEHGNDPRNYRVNFGKVKEVIGFEPKFTVPDGIKEVLDALANQTFAHVDEQKNLYGNYEMQYPVK